MPTRTFEGHFIAMAAGAQHEHGTIGCRLEADHAVDVAMLGKNVLHAAQVAQLFFADIADEEQVADGLHLVVVEYLEP